MLTKEQLIEKLKEKQHLLTPDCISIAQDRYFLNDKVKYALFIFKCDKDELYIDRGFNECSRWWQDGKSFSDASSVFFDKVCITTDEYEFGFENCTFNLNELLGE